MTFLSCRLHRVVENVFSAQHLLVMKSASIMNVTCMIYLTWRCLFLSCCEQCLKSESLRKQLSDIDHLSKRSIDCLAAKFLEDVSDGVFRTTSWEWATHHIQYSESKAFLNAYTRVLAKLLEKDGPNEQKIFVNAASPGWTKSDMTKHHEDAQPVEKGADTPVWLALLPREGYPNGKFFANREETGF